MSARDWKPGDIVSVYVETRGRRHIALRIPDHIGFPWLLIDSPYATSGADKVSNNAVTDARPLVTIDPEDREQVERLAKAMHESDHIAPWHDLHNETRAQIEDAMQAALREFANLTPPKPDEPTGLGAVVEDDKGHLFVRIALPFDGWAKDRDWRRIGGDIAANPYYGYDRIAAVRVLSEGVTE